MKETPSFQSSLSVLDEGVRDRSLCERRPDEGGGPVNHNSETKPLLQVDPFLPQSDTRAWWLLQD